MLEYIVFSLLNSLLYGMLLFMLCSGLTLIFSMMGVLNFAHASFFMLGAYFAFQISQFIGFWPAWCRPAAGGGAGDAGGTLRVADRPPIRPCGGIAVYGRPGIHHRGGRQLDMGPQSGGLSCPQSLDFALFSMFGTNVAAYRIFMLVIAVGMFIALYLVLTRSRLGLIIQAAITHPDGVSALGHNVPAVFMLVFGGGSALAGLAGVIGGNYLITEPSMAARLGPIVFVVIVVGGMGSITGAFVAALLLAALQTFAIGIQYSFSDLFAMIGFNPTLRACSGISGASRFPTPVRSCLFSLWCWY
jgi:branched-chain amino acid transport system permease protein